MEGNQERIINLKKLTGLNLNEFIQIDLQNMIDKADEKLHIFKFPKNLAEKVESGEVVNIFGSDDSGCNLCSNTCTYSLNVIEASTDFLLIDNIFEEMNLSTKPPIYGEMNQGNKSIIKRVHGIFTSIVEAVKITPNLSRLRKFLSLRPLENVLVNEKIDMDYFFSFDDIIKSVQISNSELIESLLKIHAFDLMDSKWALIDHDKITDILLDVLHVLKQFSFNPREIKCSDIVDFFYKYKPDIVQHVLIIHSTNKDRNTKIVSLCEKKVSKTLFYYLLKKSQAMYLDDLLKAVKQLMETILEVDVCALKGIGIISTRALNSIRKSVIFFPIDNLPSDPIQRIQKMFLVQHLWNMDDFNFYLSEYVDSNSLITKYTLRVKLDDGGFYYRVNPAILF